MPEYQKLQNLVQKEFELPIDSFQQLLTHNTRINEKYKNSAVSLQQLVMNSNQLNRYLDQNRSQWEAAEKELDRLEALVLEIETYVNEI